ncbi:MAG TPA: hypothetical protein VLS51_04935 [Propionibacteriaceae bacterium]|nr:hypothetical protein [Propionibacteriaceae bacterium]
MTVVLVPVSAEQLSQVQESTLQGPVTGFAVTPALCETFGLGPTDGEEADRTALLLAGLAALLAHGRRLALVVEARASDTGDAFGEVTVQDLSWRDVSAVFADAPEAADLVAAATRATEGLDLDAAWDTDEVQSLMKEHDLLWFGPEEADVVLGV